MNQISQENQLNNEAETQNAKIDDDGGNSIHQDVFYLNNFGDDIKSLGTDEDCPLNFPMVQHQLDEYNYQLQNQQNELIFIQNSIKQVQSLIGDLTGENDVLKSIINEFDENYKIKNKLQSNLKSQEIKNYTQKVDSTVVDFLNYETKLTEDVTNVTQCTDKIKSLRIMNNTLKEQINNAPALGADEIIDLLESDIEDLEKQNQKIREKYIDSIMQYQDEIDQLQSQLNMRPEHYLTETTNVPPVKKKLEKQRNTKKTHKK